MTISLFDEFGTVPAGDFVPRREKVSRARSIVGDSGGQRAAGDFYPTPPEAVHSLLDRETFPGLTWEPACGDGSISKVLIARGHQVISTDLYDRGFGETGMDFLTTWRTVDNIVTNPPYVLALPFARHALECARRKVAMLLKVQFDEGVERYKFFLDHPYRHRYVFSRRLTLYKNGVRTSNNSGMATYAWYIWERDENGAWTGEEKTRRICDLTNDVVYEGEGDAAAA